MRIDLELVEVEGSIFIAGTNLGPKIDERTKISGTPNVLYYDTETRLTYIVHKGKKWFGNVKGQIEKQDAPKATERLTVTSAQQQYEQRLVRAQATGPEKTIRTAQVSTPHDKVQGGPNKKKAKYQGEEA